jgi:D-alanine-D-alanine ligase
VTSPAVIFGGASPEHDISVLTGLQAARALAGAGPAPTCLYWSKTGEWYEVEASLEGGDFAEGIPRKARPLRLVVGPGGGFVGESGPLRKERPIELSAAIICCHGAPGEDGTLQAALDLAGIRYTGPDVAGAALGMDKLAFGAVAAAAGLPVLRREGAVNAEGWAPSFPGPYIVKPRFGGSSIGIAVAADSATILALLESSVHLRSGAVVEPYRPSSVDLEIAVRTHPRLEVSAISKPERAGEIYSYQQKYVGGEGMASSPREINPELPGETAKAVREHAAVIAGLIRARGVARVDYLLDGDDLYLNEVNTIPGSLARHLWVDPVVPFATLLSDMLDEATTRPTTHWTTAGADGTALRSAGTIASKLG